MPGLPGFFNNKAVVAPAPPPPPPAKTEGPPGMTEEAVLSHNAELEVQQVRKDAAEINVLEGVIESLQYGTWKTVAVVRGLDDCKNRMVLQWQTTGVVSVLLASLLMPQVVDPPMDLSDDMETDVYRVARAFRLLNFFSLILNLGCILLAYILVIEVDQVVTELDFSEFVARFQHWDEVLKIFFTMSCLCLLGVIMTAVYNQYRTLDLMADFWGCITFISVMFAMVATGATMMDMFTKARLSVARKNTKANEVDLVADTAKKAAIKERAKKLQSDGASVHSGSMISATPAPEKPDRPMTNAFSSMA